MTTLTGLQDAREILRRAAVEVFTVRERPPISAWADEHRNLVKGERQGKWKTDDVPYAKGIFDALQDPSVRQVTLMKAAQLGGSEIFYCWLCWMIDQDPADTLLVMPNEDKAAHLKVNRLIPTFNQCPAVLKQVASGKEKFEGLLLQFNRMNLRLIGSKSKADIEGDPFGRVMVDETDRCEEGTVELVRERTKTFARVKIGVLGTPKHEEMGVSRQYLQGTQERYQVPCPFCKAYFAREWRQVKWKGGMKADPDEVMQSAWYRCPHCRKDITSEHNRWQLSRGVWVPKGCGAKHDGTLVVPDGLKIAVGHRSFHLHGLDNALVANPYGMVARGWIDAGGVRTETWTTDTCGEAWKQAGDKLELKTLQDFCAKSTYLRGHVPPEVLCLACGADVQHDRIYATIWGFGVGGRTAYKIAWAEIPLDHGNADPLIGLSRWIDERRWMKNGSKLPVMAEFVDSGDQAELVYRSCRRRGMRVTKGGRKPQRVPVKGNPSISAPWKLSVLDGSKAGGDGLTLLHVNTMHWTSWLLGQLGVKQSEEGMEHEDGFEDEDRLTEDGRDGNARAESTSSVQPQIFFPRDTDDATLAHYTNESLKSVVVRGRRTLQWQLRDAHAPNHYCDAGRYALAGADMRGVRNVGLGKTKATNTTQPQAVTGNPGTPVQDAGKAQEAGQKNDDAHRVKLPDVAQGRIGHNPLAYAQRR